MVTHGLCCLEVHAEFGAKSRQQRGASRGKNKSRPTDPNHTLFPGGGSMGWETADLGLQYEMSKALASLTGGGGVGGQKGGPAYRVCVVFSVRAVGLVVVRLLFRFMQAMLGILSVRLDGTQWNAHENAKAPEPLVVNLRQCASRGSVRMTLGHYHSVEGSSSSSDGDHPSHEPSRHRAE